MAIASHARKATLRACASLAENVGYEAVQHDAFEMLGDVMERCNT